MAVIEALYLYFNYLAFITVITVLHSLLHYEF